MEELCATGHSIRAAVHYGHDKSGIPCMKAYVHTFVESYKYVFVTDKME